MAYNLRGQRQDYKTLNKKGLRVPIMTKESELHTEEAGGSTNVVVSDSANHVDTNEDTTNAAKSIDSRRKALEAKQLALEQLALEQEELEMEEKLLAAQEALAAKKQALAARRASLAAPAPAAPQQQRPNDDNTHASSTNQPREASTVTASTLAHDKALNEALDVLKTTGRSMFGLQDILSSPHDMEEPNRPRTSGKTPLYINDFILNPSASTRASEQNLGRGLILRDARSKIKTEDVTMEQWAGANARILIELLDSMEREQVVDYLTYTAQIADLMQVCKRSSVLLLDESHRTRVHQSGCKWDDIDQMRAYVFLNKKEEEPKPTSKRPWGPSKEYKGPTDSNGRPICLNYNREDGCLRSHCRFAHTCSVPGCKENHPKFKHQENVPPRFRPFRDP